MIQLFFHSVIYQLVINSVAYFLWTTIQKLVFSDFYLRMKIFKITQFSRENEAFGPP